MKKTLKNNKAELPTWFRYRDLDGRVLVTNDAGEYAYLSKEDFELLSQGRLDEENSSFLQLKDMGILGGRIPAPALVEKYKMKNLFLFQGPALFIVVPTLRCNKRCLYCHASARELGSSEFDMNIETGKRVVDVIFDSPGINLSLEFQGGEPLLNWEVVKFISNYAIEKNKMFERNLFLSIVTNLTLLDKAKLDFAVSRKIGISTSLDGPDFVHDKNRGGGQSQVVKKLKQVIKRYREEFQDYSPGALTTVTRAALPYHKEIVDTFVDLKLDGIHLRPLNPIGFAQPVLNEIGYSPEEFLDFYALALDYIIDLNKQGTFLVDRTAWLFLSKIFGQFDPNYLDLRSPCGAGIGQIAFNYNGNVYTCDEGRMLAMQGDESFCMGNIFENEYDEMVNSRIVKQTCLASILEGIPQCDNCAYKPYCGVCPLLNYMEEGSLFARIPQNRRHKINQGILDMIFRKLQDQTTKDIFFSWLERGIGVA